MSFALYKTFLPIYLTNDLSILIFTVIISSINFLQIFMRTPLDNLSQVIGRKPMILISNFSINVAILLLFLANSFFIVFLSSLLVSFGMSSYYPANYSYIKDSIDINKFGKNNGRIFRYGDLGILLGFLFSKIFFDEFLLSLRQFFLTISILGFFFNHFNLFYSSGILR